VYSSDSVLTTSLALADRWSARYVHGGKAGDFDGDGRSDLFVYRQATGKVYVKTQSGVLAVTWAAPGGVPALLDYDGDSLTDLGIWEPGTGTWRIRRSSDGATALPDLGKAGDIPVPGDYHGLDKDQIAVFRPSTATWIIEASREPSTFFLYQFGEVGDLPVPADWDGDGDIDLGVWRPSTGRWYARDLQGNALPIPSTPWGQAGDIPLAGNFTGSSVADQAVYRKQLGVIWVRDGATGTTQTLTVGFQGIAVPLDWDGNGRVEPVMFDASSGSWRIDANTSVSFGTIGDIPAGAQ
jgi:hypothetical protein